MEYNTIVTIQRKDKIIIFFLREGEDLSSENIVDVEIVHRPSPMKAQSPAHGEAQTFKDI
jgi:hypothetical protein